MKPCKYGHTEGRYPSGKCKGCIRQWSENNHEKILAAKRRYNNKTYAADPKKQRAIQRNWKASNKAAVRAYQRAYKARRYREGMKNVPAWSEKAEITEFYANRPDGYHVDHIIPLRGKTVCGLHVLENLQYLLAAENQTKGNRV